MARVADVVVVGCGAIGLPLAVALASRGARVTGFDIDAGKVRALRTGDAGMLDEGLAAALNAVLQSGALDFTDGLAASPTARAYIIAVPTPVDADGRFVDGPLRQAWASVSDVAGDRELVVVRSTTPVGTVRRLSAACDGRLAIAACPDRSISGRAFAEQFAVPHIIGGMDAAASQAARDLFAPLGDVRLVSTPEAAEATKLFANVWRDARFALANQLALYCEGAGLDFEEIRSAGADGFARFDLPRAGPVGGPCLIKDVYLLTRNAQTDLGLFEQARAFNRRLAEHVVRRVADEVALRPGPARVAVLGLAFKGSPPTLDQRGSLGLEIAEGLGRSLEVRGWDPAAEDRLAGDEAVAGASAIVLATDHPLLADPRRLDGCAEGAFVYDLCGILPDGAPTRSDLVVDRLGRGRR